MKFERLKEGIGKKAVRAEYVEKRPHIEIDGRREVIVSGCTKISEYGADAVMLRCYSTGVRISGNALELVLLSGRVVAVRGSISGIEFL